MLSRFVGVGVILLVFVGSVFSVQAQTAKKSVVAFYNLENLFDTIASPGIHDDEFTPGGAKKWDASRYWLKIDQMAAVIAALGEDVGVDAPAVVGLCEVENKAVVEDLVRQPALQPFNYQIVHHDSPDPRGIDVCMIYRPEYFKVTQEKAVPLPGGDTGTEHRVYTRDLLVVSGDFNGEPIHFIVNHWPSRYGGRERSVPLRRAAARLMRSLVDSICAIDRDAQIVAMGDFNDNPTDASVQAHLGTKVCKKNIQGNDLFNVFHRHFEEGQGTLVYQGQWLMFDQFFVSASLLNRKYTRHKMLDAFVYNAAYLREAEGKYKGYPLRTYVGNRYLGGYSDHLPVCIVLKQ